LSPSAGPLAQESSLGRWGHRPLVRLKWCGDRVVQVHSLAVKNGEVPERNCVVATRGGEQRNGNDQSVARPRKGTTKQTRFGRRRRASLLANGEAWARASGEEPRRRPPPRLGAPRRWLETEWSAVTAQESGRPPREPRRSSCWQRSGRTARDGVRASIGATKRGNARGAKGRRKVEAQRP